MSATAEISRPGVTELLKAQWADEKFLCVGIDPVVPDDITDPTARRENLVSQSRAIVDATKDIAAAYKPNSAFFERVDGGFEEQTTIAEYIQKTAPNVPIFGDAKRGDIGTTNIGYREAAQRFKYDAITLHPTLGGLALETVLNDANRMGIVLVKTSNEDSGEFQDLELVSGSDEKGHLLWERVAYNVGNTPRWQENASPLGIVVGATYPEEIRRARELAGQKVTILIPGVGEQGGDLEKAVLYAANNKGVGFLINVSRGISQPKDENGNRLPVTIESIRAAAIKFDNQIRQIRGKEPLHV